jgi:hypothetical protein
VVLWFVVIGKVIGIGMVIGIGIVGWLGEELLWDRASEDVESLSKGYSQPETPVVTEQRGQQ